MKKSCSPAFKAQIVRELLKEAKSVNQLAAEHGLHPNQLYRWRDIAMNGLPNLFAREGAELQAAKDAAHEQQVQELYAEIGKLTTQLNGLKKSCHTDRDERLTFLDRGQREVPLRTLADLLSLNRSSLYYRPVSPSADDLAIKHR